MRFVEVVSCVTPRALDHLEETYEIVRGLGADAWRVFDIFPAGRAAGNPELVLGPSQIRELVERVAVLRARGRQEGLLVNLSEEGFLGWDYEGRVRDQPYFCRAGINIGGLLADGTMALVVLSIEGDRVRCRVEQGGLLLPHKGVNLPGTRLSLPCLTSKDLEDLAFGLERGVDYVALSFVRKPGDMLDLRERIRKAGSNAGTVAKIERPEAVRASEEILDASDAVMVARGDLGVELGAERVPIVQKQLIQRAREKGVPVITATEMLESMTEANRPTRAEASDVANAIEDGTSALMLSAETASGKHPVRVVETMDRIARYSEKTLRMPEVEPWIVPGSEGEVAEAVVHAACRAAEDLKVRAIVVFTRSGATARKVARYRLKIPVYAFTPDPEVQRKMSLFWGVDSRLSPRKVAHPKELLVGADEELRKEGAVRPGDLLVMVAGYLDVRGTTNTMRIWVVGKDGGMD